MNLIWTRRFADSNSNFDLILLNPKDLDSARMHKLLESIVQETHREQTLNRRAIKEFRRFFDHPDTPLRNIAYVLLSNWFLTRSGDRNSLVASRCEDLWDGLFPCRPLERLSSPAAGKNHIVLVSEFQSFWSRILKAQGETASPEPREVPSFHAGDELQEGPQGASRLVTSNPSETSGDSLIADGRVRGTLAKNGLHYQVEGSPRAMADFLDHWLKKTAEN